MSKFTRWKGGLKGGNRREVDMTSGSFNKDYRITTLQETDKGLLDWKVSADVGASALTTSRLEGDEYIWKAEIQDSVHSDTYEVTQIGGGLRYVKGSEVKDLITTGVGDRAATILNNGNSGLDFLIAGDLGIRALESIGDPYENPPAASGSDTFYTTDWEVPFQVRDMDSIYYSFKASILEEGREFRVSLFNDEGHIWYETMPEYQWDIGTPEERFISTGGGLPTEVIFDNPFFIDSGDFVRARLQFREPTTLQGIIIRDPLGTPIPGPHDGKLFFLELQFTSQDVKITEIDFKSLGHGVLVTDINTLEDDTLVMKTIETQATDSKITTIETDSTLIHVEVEWDRSRAWSEIPTVDGIPVNITSFSDGVYKGGVDIPLDLNASSILIERGVVKEIVNVIRPQIPEVLSATLTQVYPGSQTELKAGDLYELNINTDIPVTTLKLVGGLSVQGDITFPPTDTISLSVLVTNTNIGLSNLNQSFKVGTPYLSSLHSTSNSLQHNNLYPTISVDTISYPVTQQALKDNEQALVYHSISDYDTVLYQTPLNHLSVSNPSTYETKSVTRIAGDYNVTLPNLSITATRQANGAVSLEDVVINIVNVNAQVHLVPFPTALRSGGNDGTLPQVYAATLSSDQLLLEAPSCDVSIGTLLGSGFSWSSSSTLFTRDLEIDDDVVKGQGFVTNLIAKGLSGLNTTIFTGNVQYVSAGFVARDLLLSGGNWKVTINVTTYNVDKLKVFWDFTDQYLTRSTTVIRPNPGKFYINEVNSDLSLLDKEATDASTQFTIVTVEEVI